MKKIIPLLLLLLPGTLCAYTRKAPPDQNAIWLRAYPDGKKAYEYMEVGKDGAALYFNTLKVPPVLKAGKVDASIYRDLLQELDNADIFGVGQETERGQFLYSRGSEYLITAVLKGEMLTAKVPAGNLSSGTKLALGELSGALAQLEEPGNIYRFITAAPLGKDEVKDMETANKKKILFYRLEAAELDAVKTTLARALIKPYRLVPVQDKAVLKQIGDFLFAHKIKPDLDSYFIETSRGKYRVTLINPGR
jgi:hypothetical protein